MTTEMLHIILFFIICIIIFFVFRNFYIKAYNSNVSIKENFSNEKSSGAHGIAGNAPGYSNDLKSSIVKLNDQLLIGKYRTDYENSILHLDDYLNTLMLHAALNIDHSKDPSNPCTNFEKLSTLYNSKQALNSIMKHIDAN